jgi:molecular chaperone DnaK (HSP70)
MPSIQSTTLSSLRKIITILDEIDENNVPISEEFKKLVGQRTTTKELTDAFKKEIQQIIDKVEKSSDQEIEDIRNYINKELVENARNAFPRYFEHTTLNRYMGGKRKVRYRV